MKRDIAVERLFTLGDYKNVKFISEIKDIPEEFAMDEEVVGMIYFGQVLECDIAYRRYYELMEKITKDKIKDVRGFMEEAKSQNFAELRSRIENSESPKSLTPLESNLAQVGTDNQEPLVGYTGETED